MNAQEVVDYMHEQQGKRSSMGIYTPSDCRLPDLKTEPLMILHVPRIIHDVGVIYGWLWSRGILGQTKDPYDFNRLYVERGAISELAIDVMFGSMYVASLKWSGLFNFADYDFVREGNKRVTIGVTSSRQADMETYTGKQAVGMNYKGNPGIQYSRRKIDKTADYLVGVSVKSTNDGSDVAIWGAITKRRLTPLMNELHEKGFGLITGNDVWLPLRANEAGLKGFSRRDFVRLLTLLGCSEELQSIEDTTNAHLRGIAVRTSGYHEPSFIISKPS